MDQTPLNHLWRFSPGTCGDHQGSKVSTHNYIILFHFFQQFWNQFTQFCNQQVSGFQVFQASRFLFQFSQPTQNIAPLPEPKRETRQSLLLGIFHGNWGNQNRWKWNPHKNQYENRDRHHKMTKHEMKTKMVIMTQFYHDYAAISHNPAMIVMMMTSGKVWIFSTIGSRKLSIWKNGFDMNFQRREIMSFVFWHMDSCFQIGSKDKLALKSLVH